MFFFGSLNLSVLPNQISSTNNILLQTTFKKINWLKFLDVDCFFNNILGHFISSWMLPIRSWHVFNVYDKYWAKRKFKCTTAIKFVIKFCTFNIRRVRKLNKLFHVIQQKHWTSKCLIASMKELIPQWKEGYHI